MVVTAEMVAWMGMLIGVLARIALPYLRKVWTGEVKEFEIYHIWVGFAGLILSLIVSLLLAPNMLVFTNATFIQLIVANFAVGFGSTSLIHEVFAFNEVKKKTVKTT